MDRGHHHLGHRACRPDPLGACGRVFHLARAARACGDVGVAAVHALNSKRCRPRSMQPRRQSLLNERRNRQLSKSQPRCSPKWPNHHLTPEPRRAHPARAAPSPKCCPTPSRWLRRSRSKCPNPWPRLPRRSSRSRCRLSTVRPRPRPAERVADVPVDAPEPTAPTAEDPTPAVADEPIPDAPVVTENQPETQVAPTTTEIVTEATETTEDAPTLAPDQLAAPAHQARSPDANRRNRDTARRADADDRNHRQHRHG